MKKVFSVILALALVIACLAGCGGNSGNEGSSTAPAADDGTTAAQSDGEVSGKATIWVWTSIQDHIDAYEASHPGTEIEEVIVDAGDYMTKVTTTMASGGELPDVLLGEILSRGQLFSLDILEDLTKDPFNFDPNTVDASVLNTMKNTKGEIVGIEASVSPAGLAYHRDLAKQYFGVSEPEEMEAKFKDWDSLIDACVQAKEASGGKQFAFTSLGDLYYVLNGQMTETRITDGTIHKDTVLQLMSDICKFRDAGIVNQIEQWTPAWFASFGTSDAIFGSMPSYAYSNWYAPAVPEGESGDWGLMIPPKGGFLWGGTAYCVTKASQNKALAYDFIYWLLCGDGNARRLADGETPAVTSAYTDEILNKEYPLFANQKLMSTYINDILPNTTSVVPSEYDLTDITAMETVLSALNTDYSMTPEAAVDLYIEEMQNMAPELNVD